MWEQTLWTLVAGLGVASLVACATAPPADDDRGPAESCREHCMDEFHRCRERRTGGGRGRGRGSKRKGPPADKGPPDHAEGGAEKGGRGASGCAHRKNECMEECRD